MKEKFIENMTRPNSLRAFTEVVAGVLIGTMSTAAENDAFELIGTMAGAALFFGGIFDPLISGYFREIVKDK